LNQAVNFLRNSLSTRKTWNCTIVHCRRTCAHLYSRKKDKAQEGRADALAQINRVIEW